ncbi:AMP-binding protein, partial [Duganella sp. Root1480D1]|uniref:AMP-binding protein n=1 Tax=Duganella sp. Root1480D1 TaxID=1736471 RepID=UPI0035A66458
MAASPQLPLQQLVMNGEAEMQQLLHDFNATTRSYPGESLVHAEFARLAAAQPQAPALLGEQATVSYGELNARANRVAHYLRALGIGPDARVGLCLERGADMIVAMLAVLKAGGAYVPLDAGYPAERLAFMLADSAPAVLLTTAALEDVLPVQSLTRVLLLDDDSYGDVTAVARQPDSDPLVPGLGARNLAYVMYTSGSTGQPKGVMIEHRNVLRLALNSGFAPLTPADRVAHCASPAFDAATWEIWAPLLNGASVLLVPQAVVLAPQQLCQALVALVPGLGARHLAYVMYTSGSTGQPKGVMIEHRNVLRLALNSGFAPLTPADRVAHCASPAFDAATWEIWAPLLNGASVLLVPQAVVLAPQQLCQALVAGGATALWLTVGLFNEYRPALGAAFAGLRYLLVGGDALDVDSVRQLLASEQRPQQLINGYGPTEST